MKVVRIILSLIFVFSTSIAQWSSWSNPPTTKKLINDDGLIFLFNPIAERGLSLGNYKVLEFSGTPTKVPLGISDFSGNLNGGTCLNGMELNANADPYAFEFDGTDDYIDLGDTLDIFNYDFILFAWVKNIDVAKVRGIAGKFSGTNPNFYFRSNGSGDGADGVYFRMEDGTNVYYAYKNYTKSGYHMLTFVVDRSSATCKIYDNLTELNLTHSGTLSAVGSVSNSGSFRIGSIGTAGQYAKGYIGILGFYLYDGKDGRPSSLPSNYYDSIIKFNYENAKEFYK